MRELTPEVLRAIGDGERSRYVCMLATPELMAAWLERDSPVSDVTLKRLTTDDEYAIDGRTGEEYLIVHPLFVLTTKEPTDVAA